MTGGGFWLLAQVLEYLEWDGDLQLSHYWEKVTGEELLEFLGSGALFLAAAYATHAIASASIGIADPRAEPPATAPPWTAPPAPTGRSGAAA